MTTRDIAFVAVGAITALSALLSVTTKHVVHAALWLLVSLGALAGAYLVLGQELVGLVQLLVYVGAIVVLVLFALMLTRAPIGPHAEIDTPPWQRVLARMFGAATTALLASLLLPLFSAARDLDDGVPGTAPDRAGHLRHLGVALRAVVGAPARRPHRGVRGVAPRPPGRAAAHAPRARGAAPMSHLYPAALAAVLAGIGVYGVLARRNAVLVLIGVELILNAANLLLVTAGSRPGAPFAAGPVLTLFVITIAAAEVIVALAIILVMFRRVRPHRPDRDPRPHGRPRADRRRSRRPRPARPPRRPTPRARRRRASPPGAEVRS